LCAARWIRLAAATITLALIGWLALSLDPRRPSAPSRERSPDGPLVLDLADALGAVAAGHRDLWVDDRARERLVRVDGTDGRVLAAIPVRGRLAVSTGPTGVWALQSGGDHGIGLRGPLLRVDSRTNRVRARVPLHGVLAFGVLARGRSVWIWGPRDVLRVDPRTNRVAQRIRISDAHGELRGLAVRGAELTAAAADGRLIRFDARTGRRAGSVSVPLPAPAVRATLGRRLVLSSRGTVAVVNPRTGRVAWRRRLGFRAGAVVRAGGLLWVHSAAREDPGDRLTALEPATGEVRATQLLPAFGTTGMVFQGGRLWVAAAGGRVLAVRLAPAP
jgi:hypothetical protein